MRRVRFVKGPVFYLSDKGEEVQVEGRVARLGEYKLGLAVVKDPAGLWGVVLEIGYFVGPRFRYLTDAREFALWIYEHTGSLAGKTQEEIVKQLRPLARSMNKAFPLEKTRLPIHRQPADAQRGWEIVKGGGDGHT